MRLDKLTEILNKETGITCCPICATPFKAYHSRQKTCGSPECRKIYHSRYVSETAKAKRRESPDDYRKYKREQMAKYRRKQAFAGKLDEAEEYWKSKIEVNDRIVGLDYGQRQAEKTLANVPKIDTNIERRKP